MIQLGILLIAGGLAGATWRDYRKKQNMKHRPALPPSRPGQARTKQLPPWSKTNVFDDVGEIHHYQKVSWYALALATSGSWFYPPAKLISIPLLSYNTYHFFKVVRQSDKTEQKSPLTIFESIGIVVPLVTGSVLTSSVMQVFSFGTRKLLLQVGNIASNIGFSSQFNLRHAKVWVMRDGAEVETPLAELQQDDVVVLHAGDTIVLEGKVLEGAGSVRQFSLRKQIKLIPKLEGDRVYPFTQLKSGCLYVQPS